MYLLHYCYDIPIYYFDEDNGKFKVLVDGYFNKDGGEVRKLLDQSFDLKKTDSPFYQLIKNIEEATGKDENAITAF